MGIQIPLLVIDRRSSRSCLHVSRTRRVYTLKPWRLPLPVTPLPLFIEAWRSPAGTLLHPPPRRRAAGSSSTSPSPLLDQEGGDVIPTVRVLNAEVPSVRRWSSVIWITTSTTPSSTFFLNASAAIYKWYVDALLSPRC